jgi:hypothetical protein
MARANRNNPTLVPLADRALLETPTGRENDHGVAERGTLAEDEIRDKEILTRPRSAITGRHDAGSGANETEDGLNDTEEEVREFAEDLPVAEERDDGPVFERGLTPPKV